MSNIYKDRWNDEFLSHIWDYIDEQNQGKDFIVDVEEQAYLIINLYTTEVNTSIEDLMDMTPREAAQEVINAYTKWKSDETTPMGDY